MKTAKATEQLFKTMKTLLKSINLGLTEDCWHRFTVVSQSLCAAVESHKQK